MPTTLDAPKTIEARLFHSEEEAIADARARKTGLFIQTCAACCAYPAERYATGTTDALYALLDANGAKFQMDMRTFQFCRR